LYVLCLFTSPASPLTPPQGLQAMDNSHVALVTVQLDANEFDSYRCDRNMPLGVNVRSAYVQLSLTDPFRSSDP
jgi:hypothetical protein